MSKISASVKGQFTDLEDQVIANLFKLYPWEFMLREMFSTKLEDAGVRWLEPASKSIISNKALLPLLWEMFPNHQTCCLRISPKTTIRRWKNSS